MKKLFVLLLAVMVIMTGCAGNVSDETIQITETIENTTPGLYMPGSSVEEQTGGAVRFYRMPEGGYTKLSAIGDQILLVSEGESTEIKLLTGSDCIVNATVTIPARGGQALYNGYAYYDPQDGNAVFLDAQLQELERIPLPAEIQGNPVFSPDGGEIFYCTGKEIRGIEVERKLSRLIKSQDCASQTILGCYFEGKVLSCRVEDNQGVVNTLYISTETGQTLRTDNNITALYSYEDQYIAMRTDGMIRQEIVGTLDGDMQHLDIAETYIASALEFGGAVSYGVDEDDNLHFAFYDLASGQKTAAVSVAGVGTPESLMADRWSGSLWFLSTDVESGEKALFRWSLKNTPVDEETIYLGDLYTSQSPDSEGLDACNQRVNSINKTYGTRIRIWQEAVKTTGGHSLVPEHQIPAINSVLDALEPVLAEFPANFLMKSVNSRLRICVVRSVDGESKSVRFWDGNDAYILITAADNVREAFMLGFGYVVNSHVIGNSPIVDKWDELNPEDFTYGTADETLLSGDGRAFADDLSMQSIADDRSSIFFHAMQPDNAEMFQSEIMQQKLLLLCRGIRDAWNLERKADVYPWEQYLAESIAYQK